MLKYIKTHWSGHTDFIWLIGLNLLGVRFAIHLSGTALTDAPTPIWLILFPMIALILVWQITGTVRAAKSGLDHPDGIFKTIALFTVIMAVIITTTICSIPRPVR